MSAKTAKPRKRPAKKSEASLEAKGARLARRLSRADHDALHAHFSRKIRKVRFSKMAGRQIGQINDQAKRYGLLMGSSPVDLCEFLPSLFEFLAANANRLRHPMAEDDSDALMSASGDSPSLERWRTAKAELAELNLAEKRWELVDAGSIQKMLDTYSAVLRGLGETLDRRYGHQAAALLESALDSADRISQQFFHTEDRDNDDAEHEQD